MASLRDVLPSVPSFSLPSQLRHMPSAFTSSQEALKSIPSPPLGARLTSRGVVDDLWTAKPTPDKPYPIVLIHGTIAAKGYWEALMAQLREEGFVVFAPDFGVYGTNRIQDSAVDVGAYIDQVLLATGAEKVDIVGHSQGGLLARYWITHLGGASKVHHLVSLSASHHGTTLSGMLSPVFTSPISRRAAAALTRRVFGAAGMQQVRGSALLEEFAESPECLPGIRYTCIVTKNDSTIVPPESGFLLPPEESTSDTWLRCLYAQDDADIKIRHEEMPMNQLVRDRVLEALEVGLDSGLPADATREENEVVLALLKRQSEESAKRIAYFEKKAAKASKGTEAQEAASAEAAGVDLASAGEERAGEEHTDGASTRGSDAKNSSSDYEPSYEPEYESNYDPEEVDGQVLDAADELSD